MKKKERSGFSISAFTLLWAGLPYTTDIQTNQLQTNQCLPTARTEIPFAVPVWVGERGIHSFKGEFTAFLLFQKEEMWCPSAAKGHQLPNRAGKIEQTKVMLHQISPSQSRQVPRHGYCLRWLCLEQKQCGPTGGERILQPT